MLGFVYGKWAEIESGLANPLAAAEPWPLGSAEVQIA
jgi:hypothetical protein